MVLLSPYPKNEWSENTTSKCLYKLCISNKIKQSRNTLEKLIFLNMGKKLTSFILKPWDALYSRFSILSMIQNPLELLIRDMTLWASPLEYPGAGRAGSIQSQCQRNSRKSLQISKEILIYQLKTWGSVLQKNSRMLLLNSCHPPHPQKELPYSEGLAMFTLLCISVSNPDNWLLLTKLDEIGYYNFPWEFSQHTFSDKWLEDKFYSKGNWSPNNARVCVHMHSTPYIHSYKYIYMCTGL